MTAPVHDVPTALALMKAAPLFRDLLKEVCVALDQEVAERDGQDPLGIQVCSLCDGGLGDHSLGCRIRAALLSVEPKREPKPPGPFVAQATRDCVCGTCAAIRLAREGR